MQNRLMTFMLCLLCLAACAGTVRAQGIEAITKPSEDVTLSFVRPGQIAGITVKEGDQVNAGQLLVQQEDAAERAQLAQLKAQAEDTLRIRAAEAQLAQKRVDLEKLEHAAKSGAVPQWDVEHARLDVVIAEMSLDLAKFQHQQDIMKYDELYKQLERMQLKTPIAGRVERIWPRQGESVDALAKVIRVVRIDPLWLDVPVPLKVARGLKLDQEGLVAFPGEDEPVRGRIIHVAAVADAASDTLLVRVEVANAGGRPAGERPTVVFPTATGSKEQGGGSTESAR